MPHLTLHPEPGEDHNAFDFVSDGERCAAFSVDGTRVIVAGGDAAIVSVTGALIEALTGLRSQAMERIRAEHNRPALPDGLDAATMAEAVAGWTESDLQGAWGK